MNAHDTVRLLNEFYTTAVLTGTADRDAAYCYAEIADEIHKTIKLVMTGHDPESCRRDLVDVLKVGADAMPSGRFANIWRGWVYALTPEDTNA